MVAGQARDGTDATADDVARARKVKTVAIAKVR
jgi:hypothetical protein